MRKRESEAIDGVVQPVEMRAHVAQLTPEMITINSRRYEIAVNHKDAVDITRLAERYDDILSKYDYILGDWGYDQLRLKGFFNDDYHQSEPDQRIGRIHEYLLEFCNFGCAYFILRRLDAPEKTSSAPKKRWTPSTHTDTKSRRNNYKRDDDLQDDYGAGRYRSARSTKPYAERRGNAPRPKRGDHERAATTSKGYGRHFTIKHRAEQPD